MRHASSPAAGTVADKRGCNETLSDGEGKKVKGRVVQSVELCLRRELGRERTWGRERERESGGVITHSGPYTIPLCSLYRFCREQGPHASIYV